MRKYILFIIVLILLMTGLSSALTVNLIADGGDESTAFDAGNVDISYDGANIIVRITVEAPWEFVETHVHVADSVDAIPQKNGNPKPGKFDYKNDDAEATTVTATIHEYTIPYTPAVDTVIAVHASIEWWEEITEEPYFILHEAGGWAEGEDFSGKNWAMYIEYGITLIFNDDCENAESIGDFINMPFDTTAATMDGPYYCMYSPNIWYCYAATCTGNVTVSLAGSSYDTMLAVYEDCECPIMGDLIECNDDFGDTRQSQITFDAIEGEEYLIEVGGYGGQKGVGLLSISCEEVSPPPSSKDDCENAKPIGDVIDSPFDTTDATFDGPGLCMTSPNIWYCYTATCTGNVTVSLAGSSFDTMLAAYDGCECYPTLIDLLGCNDDAGSGYQSEITFAAIEGNDYLIEVGGYANEAGEGLLSISCQ